MINTGLDGCNYSTNGSDVTAANRLLPIFLQFPFPDITVICLGIFSFTEFKSEESRDVPNKSLHVLVRKSFFVRLRPEARLCNECLGRGGTIRPFI